ncbi:MAG: queuosine salvage family protein [Trueperaceae bacterium]
MRIVGDPASHARELLAEDRVGSAEVEWDRATHFSGADEETAAYVFTLDSVNFGSGYFPHLQKRSGLSGYFTVALALKERFERHGPFSARELERLVPDDVAGLFGQGPGDAVRSELVLHFTRALNDLGAFLDQRFRGSFTKLLDAAAGSAERLAGLLTAMPYFRDVARYRGRDVPILKRAQITPSDLALALAGRPRGEFHDLERLTIFADNLVPHVLRLEGLLEYAPSLAQRLERGELLPAGSVEEVEIRAVALHAVEQMVAGLRASGERTSARLLDLHLWNRGQAERYRGGSKHRTRTVYY